MQAALRRLGAGESMGRHLAGDTRGRRRGWGGSGLVGRRARGSACFTGFCGRPRGSVCPAWRLKAADAEAVAAARRRPPWSTRAGRAQPEECKSCAFGAGARSRRSGAGEQQLTAGLPISGAKLVMKSGHIGRLPRVESNSLWWWPRLARDLGLLRHGSKRVGEV